MRCSFCRTFCILLADAPRYSCSRAYAQTDSHRVDEIHHRFGDAYNSDRARTQPRHIKDIDNGEKAFRHHLYDHWYGEDEDGNAERTGGKVTICSPYGLAQY